MFLINSVSIVQCDIFQSVAHFNTVCTCIKPFFLVTLFCHQNRAEVQIWK